MAAEQHEKTDVGPDERAARFFLLANRWFRYHVAIYLAGNVALYLINKATTEYWWAFWPLFAWSLLLACHFFFIRSVRADDRWAQERALRLRAKSYDIDHIRAIENSFKSGTMPGRHNLNLPAKDDEGGKRE